MDNKTKVKPNNVTIDNDDTIATKVTSKKIATTSK